MNFNVILAILQIKGIITQEEAIKVADHVEQTPLATYYKDALYGIRDIIEPPKAPSAPRLETPKIDLSNLKTANKKAEVKKQADAPAKQ